MIHRLRLLYADAQTSKELQTYVSELQNTSKVNEKRDIWDGDIVASLRREGVSDLFLVLIAGYFRDSRDIALQLSLDGVQLFKIGTVQVWPFLIMNLNKPPESRFQVKNFLPLGLSPGILHIFEN
jgi:hypothetical protein